VLLTAGAIAVSIFIFGRTLYSHNYEPQTPPYSKLEFEQVPPQPPPHLSPERVRSITITRTVTTTLHAPTTTETTTVYKDAPSTPKYEQFEPVVFSLVAWSKSSGAELSLLIKVRLLIKLTIHTTY
jgi:hypothetical protein